MCTTNSQPLEAGSSIHSHSCVSLPIFLFCSQLHVFKPATSKAGNSEQYLICLGYKGTNILSQKFVAKLKLVFGEMCSLFSLISLLQQSVEDGWGDLWGLFHTASAVYRSPSSSQSSVSLLLHPPKLCRTTHKVCFQICQVSGTQGWF